MLTVCLTMIDDDDLKATFEDLYYRYERKAFAVAYHLLHNSAMAEDACSDAFLNIAKSFQKIHNLEAHKLEKYIVITVRNASVNLLRREKEHEDVLPLNEDAVSLTDDVLTMYDHRHILQCIGQLSDTDKEILYLKVSYGLEYDEIARALFITKETARKRFQHAKESLKKLLEEGEI